MRHENRRLIQTRENFFQIFLKRGPDQRIESAERFVEQEQLRGQHERAHQADALALPTGKFEWKTIERSFGKAGQRAKVRKAALRFLGRQSEMTCHEKDVLAPSEMGEKTAILDDVADPPPELGNIRRGYFFVVKPNRAGIGIEQPNDQPQEGRFPAAARPNENGGFAASESQIGRMKGNCVAVRFTNAVKLNERIHVSFLANHERRGEAFL